MSDLEADRDARADEQERAVAYVEATRDPAAETCPDCGDRLQLHGLRFGVAYCTKPGCTGCPTRAELVAREAAGEGVMAAPDWVEDEQGVSRDRSDTAAERDPAADKELLGPAFDAEATT